MKAINRNDNIHTPRSRDEALRRLGRVNRWLIAGTAVLTGVLTDVAANAFPGHTIRKSSSRAATQKKAPAHEHKAIAPPRNAPKPDTTTQQAAPAPAETSEAPHAETQAPPSEAQAPPSEAAPAQEAAPERAHESAPAPAPVEEAPRAQAAPPPEEPAVSGGS